MESGAVGHNFERDSPRDHLCQIWLNLYKHNDELFNMYYRIFMNFELLPILTNYAD
jgi:hypothetical protein